MSLVQIGFHKDQYTLSDFVVLVLCCVIWFQQYVKNHENFSRLLKKSRKGDLMKSVNNTTDFATHLIALFELLHEGKKIQLKVKGFLGVESALTCSLSS